MGLMYQLYVMNNIQVSYIRCLSLDLFSFSFLVSLSIVLNVLLCIVIVYLEYE